MFSKLAASALLSSAANAQNATVEGAAVERPELPCQASQISVDVIYGDHPDCDFLYSSDELELAYDAFWYPDYYDMDGMCNYIPELGQSILAICTEWGWTRRLYAGDDGCLETSEVEEIIYQWGSCNRGPAGSEFEDSYLWVTTRQDFDGAKALSVAASAMALAAAYYL